MRDFALSSCRLHFGLLFHFITVLFKVRGVYDFTGVNQWRHHVMAVAGSLSRPVLARDPFWFQYLMSTNQIKRLILPRF